jgi:hypothetical protein
MTVAALVLPPTTTAAEGLPRRRFTVDEIYQMTAAGIWHEHERIELIGGGRSSRCRRKAATTRL